MKKHRYILREELFEEGSKNHGWILNSVGEHGKNLFITKQLDVSFNCNHNLKAGMVYVKGITKNVEDLVSDISTPIRKQDVDVLLYYLSKLSVCHCENVGCNNEHVLCWKV